MPATAPPTNGRAALADRLRRTSSGSTDCAGATWASDGNLTLCTYGHVIDELEDAPRIAAEDAIRDARRERDVRAPFAHRARQGGNEHP